MAESFVAEGRPRPIDVVWAVDNSSSMRREADFVQEQINTFAERVEGAGLSIRVVMMTESGYVAVPAPLGEDPARFLAIDEDVHSDEGLADLLDRYGDYEPFLRPDSVLHFVNVTDDESKIDAPEFMSRMSELARRSYTLHIIGSPPGSTHRGGFGNLFDQDGCDGPHGEAPDNADRYWEVSMATGGVQLSICAEDWTPLFEELATAIGIPTPLPCVYELPAPPDGLMLDLNRVNLFFTPDGGAREAIPFAPSPDLCTDTGWYLSEGDEEIRLCPSACGRIEDAAGQIDLAVGCQTILI